MSSCDLFTHIPQGCFIDTGAISELTLKDIGKINQYQNHNKAQRNVNHVHDSFLVNLP